jgi:hypothetical protein
MLLTFLQAAGLMDWVIIDLIFLSVFAISITINLFLLGRRLHRIEERMIFERAECRYNLQSLGKSRRLPTAELKEGECCSPGPQSKIMPPTMREDNAEFDDIDRGLDICSGCSEEASKKPTGFVCCGLDSKCSARWCDACVEVVKKELAIWGDRAQTYCNCGEKVAGYVIKRAASHRDFHFEYTGRAVSSSCSNRVAWQILQDG